MNQTRIVLSAIILNIFQTFCLAQFNSYRHEGDYSPQKAIPQIDQQNKKHKDSPQIYFDPTRHIWHACWTQFDNYKSKITTDVSVIYYSNSLEGKTWNPSKQLNYFSGDCLDNDNTVKGPMPCVGKGGEVYVTWASSKGICFQRSLDSGRTWMKEEKIINAIVNGWSCEVDGIKTNGLPVMACDLSSSEYSGRIYITWSDEKNGVKNKDVFLIYSDDKGDHWTEPILVSYHPNHKNQFKPCIKVDSLTGRVSILYLDKQNYYEGKETDLSLAISSNGGLKFDYFKVNNQAFLFNSNFTELKIDNGLRALWIQSDNTNRHALYEVLINDSTINQYYLNESGKDMAIERSFKFADKLSVDCSFEKNNFLTVVITKPLEPGFEKVLFKNKRMYAGKNRIELDLKLAGIKRGNYIVTFYYNGRNSFSWITDE